MASHKNESFNDDYQVAVVGRNFELTPSIQEYVVEKISKIERFHHHILGVQVKLETQKDHHHADIILEIDHIKVKASASTPDMYFSIDEAVNKLDAQVRKYKSKIQKHHAKGIKGIELNVDVLHQEDLIAEEEQNTPARRIREEKASLKTLSLEDAALQLELSQDAFLLFKGENDHKMKIMYRKKDGHFAVVNT